MNEKDLRYFQAAYECKNISHAAQKIFITPQGLSKAIKKLEQELDVVLFIRNTNGLLPTEYADVLYKKSHDIINSLNTIKSDILLTGQQKKSDLTTAFTFGVVDYLGIDFIYDFKKAFPNISLNIIQKPDAGVHEMMQKKACEIAVIAGPIDTTLYDAISFTSHKHCAVINKKNLLSRKKALSYKDLDHVPIALEGRQFCPFHNNMNRFLKNNVQPTIVLETSEIESTHRFASLNEGIGISVDFCALAHPYANTVILPFEDPNCTWDTYIISAKGAYLSDKARAFREFCINWMQENGEKLFHWHP